MLWTIPTEIRASKNLGCSSICGLASSLGNQHRFLGNQHRFLGNQHRFFGNHHRFLGNQHRFLLICIVFFYIFASFCTTLHRFLQHHDIICATSLCLLDLEFLSLHIAALNIAFISLLKHIPLSNRYIFFTNNMKKTWIKLGNSLVLSEV